ncbi:hypothetical protein [Enterobacter sp. CC120223-11]|uniref:hypothetical protein n=1 Tax=Enterobacter sp. CC120223-11 TaxID=1378073 RepID=UPI000BC385CA|nr:hypothetical protein [Enterobacter sp. CC120223-11]SNY79796.1 hypothetical protein SAMN02744775_04257 [Enterobacter sp. CC120223-11]
MPTKHIDDATAALLDDLYVRCVTLTQQPVKEVEVLRLAIQTGIGNITDNDILSAMSARDSVWQQLAEQTWAEVVACWPEAGITEYNFEKLAAGHSDTWQRLSDERCHTVMKERLKQRLWMPVFGPAAQLFTADDFDMNEDELRAARAHDKDLARQYRESLPALDGRAYSTLNDHEQSLALYYTSHISFTPDGQGDFTVVYSEPSDAPAA